MQANPGVYNNLIHGLRELPKKEGLAGLTKGWVPTAIGYHLQGMFKMGLNEIFKDFYANQFGQEASVKYRGIIWAMASASAEFFADIALCPMEMVKVKVQTSTPGSFPTAFGEALATIRANPDAKFPFGSLKPLWARQIPYTVVKFVGFEACVE